MRHKTIYVTIWYVVLLPVVLFAQESDVQFNHLTIEDGLSQSTVQAILQDSEGYMWMGTQDGLNKYNGYDFTVYKSDPDDSTGISDNDIRAIYEDDENRLWIGTQSEGLNLYNRATDSFTRFVAVSEDWRTLSANSVWAILEDSYGTFWVGTSYGLNRMDRETGVVERIYADTTSLSDNQITVLYEDSGKNLWIGTTNGINRFSREDSTFTPYLHGSGDRLGSESYYIRSVFEDSKGQLWVGTEEKGLVQLDWKNETMQTYIHNSAEPTSISDNAVFGLLESVDGHLWVGTGNGGLNLMNTEEGTFTRYRHQPENPQSLSNNGVNTLYRSDDGIMWIGTFAGGMDYLDPEPPQFRHFKNEPINPNSLSNNIVQSFYEDSDGHIWVGTDGGGLNLFDPETGQFEYFTHNPRNNNSISADVILDISETEEGLWLGTYGGGATLFDYENHEFEIYRHDPNNPESLGSDFVFVITPKSDGTIWFGTNLGGVNILDPETGTIRRFMADLNQPNSPETVANNDIRAIFESSNGDMWIGAYGGVLNQYDESDDRFNFYDINVTSDLYASVIQDIYEDTKGRLWLATRGGGLKEFNRATNQILTITETDGLPSNIIHAIEEDELGNLWLSTNNGLSKFNPDINTFLNYDIEDGLQSREFNPNSSMQDSEGYIYFGGVNGFNRFHPENVQVDSLVPPVVLTDLHLFNRSVSIGEDSPLQKQISQIELLTLDHDASVITFEFAALDYSANKGNQFAYKMEGFDDEWNYVGDIRRATYTNLNPGEYTFRVMVSNSDGVWDEAGVSLPIVITPPFWRTAWFLILVCAILIGSAYLIYWLRIRSIRKRNRMLATIISERTDELQKANATKDKLFSIIAHDLINISTGLSGLSGLMQESLENKKIDEVKEYSDHMHNSIGQFATMLKNMLDWARSQTGKIQYDPINFNVIDIVDEIINQQGSRAIYKNIKLTADIDEDLEAYADPDMVLVILRNLIANALKFTGEGGKIEISAIEKEDHIKISVRDNGIGMSKEMIQKLFDLDESITTLGTSNEKGTGLGISLCKDFVQKNKGKMSVESEPNAGTTISFTLPLEQETMEAYTDVMEAS